MSDLLSQAREALGKLEKLEQSATLGPWVADDDGALEAEAACVLMQTAEGHSLFDSLNRDYRHSLVERVDGEEGPDFWYDRAGRKDLEFVAALRNSCPSLLTLVSALLEEREVRREAGLCMANDGNGPDAARQIKAARIAVDAALSRFVEESGKP